MTSFQILLFSLTLLAGTGGHDSEELAEMKTKSTKEVLIILVEVFFFECDQRLQQHSISGREFIFSSEMPV